MSSPLLRSRLEALGRVPYRFVDIDHPGKAPRAHWRPQNLRDALPDDEQAHYRGKRLVELNSFELLLHVDTEGIEAIDQAVKFISREEISLMTPVLDEGWDDLTNEYNKEVLDGSE